MKRFKGYNKIMVLGTAGADEGGELYFSAPARNRCDRAAEAYFGSGFGRSDGSILIAGGYAKWLFDEPPVKREARVMAEYLIERYGIPKNALLLEDESTNTEENFTFSQDAHPGFFEDVNSFDTKLAIVSHESHLKKALVIGRRVLNCYERQLVPLPTRQQLDELTTNTAMIA